MVVVDNKNNYRGNILIDSKKDNEMMLNINNDIYRILISLNNNKEFKRLLLCTDYDTKDEKDLSIDLIDKTIVRTPLIPNVDYSVCAITINQLIPKDNSYYLQINVDIYTPLNQWVVKEGIRPLLLCSCIDSIISDVKQTGGVKYRLKNITNCSIGNDLKGFRLTYHTIIDK